MLQEHLCIIYNNDNDNYDDNDNDNNNNNNKNNNKVRENLSRRKP